jgi:hypothetical protein
MISPPAKNSMGVSQGVYGTAAEFPSSVSEFESWGAPIIQTVRPMADSHGEFSGVVGMAPTER